MFGRKVYHISLSTGEIGVCNARIECPFGPVESHFDSKREAMDYLEERNEEIHAYTAMKVEDRYPWMKSIDSSTSFYKDLEKTLIEFRLPEIRAIARFRNELPAAEALIVTSKARKSVEVEERRMRVRALVQAAKLNPGSKMRPGSVHSDPTDEELESIARNTRTGDTTDLKVEDGVFKGSLDRDTVIYLFKRSTPEVRNIFRERFRGIPFDLYDPTIPNAYDIQPGPDPDWRY